MWDLENLKKMEKYLCFEKAFLNILYRSVLVNFCPFSEALLLKFEKINFFSSRNLDISANAVEADRPLVSRTHYSRDIAFSEKSLVWNLKPPGSPIGTDRPHIFYPSPFSRYQISPLRVVFWKFLKCQNSGVLDA